MDPKGPKEQNERNEWMQGLALLAWISWEVVLWSGTGLLLGYWVAGKIGAPGWIAVITAMAGLALAFWRIYKASTKLGGPT